MGNSFCFLANFKASKKLNFQYILMKNSRKQSKLILQLLIENMLLEVTS